jgi:hypothetical protein
MTPGVSAARLDRPPLMALSDLCACSGSGWATDGAYCCSAYVPFQACWPVMEGDEHAVVFRSMSVTAPTARLAARSLPSELLLSLRRKADRTRGAVCSGVRSTDEPIRR